MGFSDKLFGRSELEGESNNQDWERIQSQAPQMIRIMQVLKQKPSLLRKIKKLRRLESNLLRIGVADKDTNKKYAALLQQVAEAVTESSENVYDYEQWIGYHLEDILIEYKKRGK